jgi:hypothetical protein
MTIISKQKIVTDIERIMAENEEIIDEEMDEDGQCKIENDTLSNILFFINQGMYDMDTKDML